MTQQPSLLIEALTSVWGIVLTSGTVFYGVPKLFKEIQDGLSDETKLEIAVAIIGVDGSRRLEQADKFLRRAFDWLWTPEQFSIGCVKRVGIVTVILLAVQSVFYVLYDEDAKVLIYMLCALPLSLVAVFLSVVAMRHEFYSFREKPGVLSSIEFALRLSVGSAVAAGIPSAVLFFPVTVLVGGASQFIRSCLMSAVGVPFVVGLTLTVVAATVLAAYLASFYLLRITSASNALVQFAFKKLDVEKKPLQALGLVMGFLMAIAVFGANLVYRLLQ